MTPAKGLPDSIRLIFLAGAILLIIATSGRSDASEPVTLAGTIVNGTAGAAVPGGLGVTAVQLDQDGKEADRKQVQADATGTFRFDGFSPSEGSRFLVGTDYLGVTYSIVKDITAGEGAVQLRIFETTEDPSSIAVSGDTTTVVKPQGEADHLEVLQLLTIMNSSDRTFVGRTEPGGRVVLELPVPAGVFDLEPAGPSRLASLAMSSRGPATVDPIIPGGSTVSFVYKVRVPRTGWPLARRVDYPTKRADILLGEGLELSAPATFRVAGEPVIGSVKYRRYRSGELVPGAEIAVHVGFATSAEAIRWWAPALGVALLAAFLVSIITMRRRSAKGATPSSARERLLREVAALDESFEAGRLEESSYRDERSRRIEELAEMSEQPS